MLARSRRGGPSSWPQADAEPPAIDPAELYVLPAGPARYDLQPRDSLAAARRRVAA